MSSTTVSTITTSATSTTLPSEVSSDYEIHHSGTADEPLAIARSERARRSAPRDWDTTHRRVPPWRPINTQRDPLETRVYNSRAEQVFVGTMFTGVFIIATAAKVWHQTLGRLNEGIFRYPIGGEL